MTETIKKKRNSLSLSFSLLGLLGNLRYLILFAVLGGYLGNCCAISVMTLGAACVAKIIDPNFLTSCPLGLLVGLTIGAGVLRGLLRFLEQYNNHYIAFKLLACLRDKIFSALRRLAPARLEGEQKGGLISMLTSDVETLEVFYAHTISPVLIAILVEGTVFLFVSLLTNIYLGLVALVAYLVIGIVVPFCSFAAVKKDGIEYRKDFNETSSYFLDSIKGIQDLVRSSAQNQRGQILDQQSKDMNRKTVSIKEKSSIVGSLSNLTVSFFILLAALIGLLSYQFLNLPLSHLIIGLVAVFSSFGPVLSLANLPSNLTQTFASGNRILDFMEEKPEVEENLQGQTFAFKSLKMQNVSFSYSDVSVLNNVSLSVKEGDIIGLIGKSGCGKSTLLKLILRYYDIPNGTIEFNGIPLKDINTASLHENVALVSQDTYLFDDTIMNNLLFVNEKATKEDVIQACKKASLNDFIQSLSKGYDTEVGLLGDSLSAGEKQRLGLARAFLSGAKLILLDEVTSNVDAINEGIILKALKEESKNHAFIIVSHRDSTIAICNQVYHMENGELK